MEVKIGFTHYWTQTRDFTSDEWVVISEDLKTLTNDVQQEQGIVLANGEGKPGTQPVFGPDTIMWNGLDDPGEDNSHETFLVNRIRPPKETWQDRRGLDFCKTARKPYDLSVTAALCYLASIPDPPAFSVTSDGWGREWLDGLEEARRALPRYADVLDIPMDILKSDRWCSPWVSNRDASGYTVRCCVDGHAYVERLHKGKPSEWYRFATHRDLAEFLEANKRHWFKRAAVVRFGHMTFDEGRVEPDIWNATGSFDKARHARIARAQAKVLAPLFPADPAHAVAPPDYVRPGQMPEPEAPRAYYFHELLDKVT